MGQHDDLPELFGAQAEDAVNSVIAGFDGGFQQGDGIGGRVAFPEGRLGSFGHQSGVLAVKGLLARLSVDFVGFRSDAEDEGDAAEFAGVGKIAFDGVDRAVVRRAGFAVKGVADSIE